MNSGKLIKVICALSVILFAYWLDGIFVKKAEVSVQQELEQRIDLIDWAAITQEPALFQGCVNMRKYLFYSSRSCVYWNSWGDTGIGGAEVFSIRYSQPLRVFSLARILISSESYHFGFLGTGKTYATFFLSNGAEAQPFRQ